MLCFLVLLSTFYGHFNYYLLYAYNFIVLTQAKLNFIAWSIKGEIIKALYETRRGVEPYIVRTVTIIFGNIMVNTTSTTLS